jgi:hypothetical protein
VTSQQVHQRVIALTGSVGGIEKQAELAVE